MKHDPQEDDAALNQLIAAADRQADAELASYEYRDEMGFCYLFWETKQRILREKYGIEWKSPADMNPDTDFD